jgi:hypothetical protein
MSIIDSLLNSTLKNNNNYQMIAIESVSVIILNVNIV